MWATAAFSKLRNCLVHLDKIAHFNEFPGKTKLQNSYSPSTPPLRRSEKSYAAGWCFSHNHLPVIVFVGSSFSDFTLGSPSSPNSTFSYCAARNMDEKQQGLPAFFSCLIGTLEVPQVSQSSKRLAKATGENRV